MAFFYVLNHHKQKAAEHWSAAPASLKASRLFLWIQPGYAIITEGFHDLSVDCMNTSFFLVKPEVTKRL